MCSIKPQPHSQIRPCICHNCCNINIRTKLLFSTIFFCVCVFGFSSSFLLALAIQPYINISAAPYNKENWNRKYADGIKYMDICNKTIYEINFYKTLCDSNGSHIWRAIQYWQQTYYNLIRVVVEKERGCAPNIANKGVARAHDMLL